MPLKQRNQTNNIARYCKMVIVAENGHGDTSSNPGQD